MQQDLFGNILAPKPQLLTIAKKGKQQLSKNQQAFNTLTQKIEKLQKEIEKKQLQFDAAMKMYGTAFYEATKKKLAAEYKIIVVLFEIYKSEKLSKTNQRYLKNILEEHLEKYFSAVAAVPDDTIKAIFSCIAGMNYDKIREKEKAEGMEEIKRMFEEIDIDTEGVDFSDDAVLAAKIAEANEKMTALEAEQAKAMEEKEKRKAQKKKKNHKQVEYEKQEAEVTAAKQKNISTIYRQLAKLFHPDLEQDAVLKAEKEILMKELTAAFEAKDLHKLLTLELKWIHKENDHLTSLADDKLVIYLQLLKQQASDLEQEKRGIMHHPQYAVLLENFGYDIAANPVSAVNREVADCLRVAENWEKEFILFESPNALKHVNQMIKDWKEEDIEMDEIELLRMMMGKKWQ